MKACCLKNLSSCQDQALVWACNKKKIQNIYAAVSKIFSD